jgi:hypothetical protein
MFVNEFFLSLSLLSFAALLCLLGAVMVIDGVIRLTGEWRNPSGSTPANNDDREESPIAGKQAA